MTWSNGSQRIRHRIKWNAARGSDPLTLGSVSVTELTPVPPGNNAVWGAISRTLTNERKGHRRVSGILRAPNTAATGLWSTDRIPPLLGGLSLHNLFDVRRRKIRLCHDH